VVSADDRLFVIGGIYEDCAYHPCLCTEVDEDERELTGISLIDGSLPRSCSIEHCGPEVLSVGQAALIRRNFEEFRARRESGLTVEKAVAGLDPSRALRIRPPGE
jgi:hypothetical protein